MKKITLSVLASFMLPALIAPAIGAQQKPLIQKNGQLQQIQPGDTLDASQAVNVPSAAVQFQQGATGAVTRAVQDKLRDTINARDFGAKCDDATDDTTPIQNALNSAPYGAEVQFPAGTCRYSVLAFPAGVSGNGQGKSATTLKTISATLNSITFAGTGSHLSNVQLAASVTRTANAYVYSAYGVELRDVAMTGQFIGVNVNGASPSALAVGPKLINVTMYNPAVGAGSAAAIFQNYSNAVVRGGTISGTASGQQPDHGLVFRNGDTTFISDTNVTRYGNGLAVIPGDGENNYSFNAANSDFDSAGTISGGVNANACLVQPSGSGNVYESHFSNVWCGLANADGALIGSLGTGYVDGMHWTAGIFDGSGGSGIHVAANVKNWSVSVGHAAGNGGSGYYVSHPSSNFQISGVRAGPVSGRGSNGAPGINIGSSSSANFCVDGDTSGNTGGGTYIAGSGLVAACQTTQAKAIPTAAAGDASAFAASTAFVQKALPCYDARRSGVKWDGVTDDTVAMVQAFTDAIGAKGAANGTCVQLPPGKGILGQVNIPNWGIGLFVRGSGMGATTIQPASATSSLFVTPTNAGLNYSLEFADFEIAPASQPTAGTIFDISNVSGIRIHNIRQNKGFSFAKFGSNANKGVNNVFVQNNILRNFLGAPVMQLDNGYDFYTWGNAFDMDIANYGCSSDVDYACQPSSFLTVHNWGGIFLGQDDPIHCGSCFYFDANYSGAIIQGIMATNEQADTCAGVGYYLHAASGAQIQGFAGSVRASSCGSDGIKFNEDSGGHIYQVTLGMVHTINNGGHGVNFLSFNSSASITGLWSGANSTYSHDNTYSSVAFGSGSGSVSLVNAHLGGGAVNLSERAKYNIDIGSGYSGRIAVDGGIFGTTLTGQINNLGSGLLTISNTPGINPVAAATVTPGASPWTYTATISPTHINLAGGTVSNVTIGGTSVCTATPCALTLVPGGSMVVTYSSAPTVVASKD